MVKLVDLSNKKWVLEWEDVYGIGKSLFYFVVCVVLFDFVIIWEVVMYVKIKWMF